METTRRRYVYSRYYLAACLVVGCDAASDEHTGPAQPRSATQSDDPPPSGEIDPMEFVPYRHSLRGVGKVDGKIPSVDMQKSPTGGAYAVFTESEGREDGTTSFREGVEVLEVGELDEDARKRRAELKERFKTEYAVKPSKVGPRLAEAIGADPEGVLTVDIRLERLFPSITQKLQRAVAEGTIDVVADYRRVRADLIVEKEIAIAAALSPVAETVEALGGRVIKRSEAMPKMRVEVPAGSVAALADVSSVALLSLPGGSGENDAIDGQEILDGTQIEQFRDATYDGEGEPGGGQDLYVAQIERGGMEDDHPAFKEYTTSSKRIEGWFECDDVDCVEDSNDNWGSSQEARHPTLVAALLVGDLTDDQDPNFTSSSDQIKRSGYAGEARIYSYSMSENDPEALEEAFDHLQGSSGPSPKPHVVNVSWSSDGNDTACLGQTELNRDANDLFLDGMAVIKSAGNEGHQSTTDCTIGSPGSAAGVFTVGAAGEAGCVGDETTVRTADIWVDSFDSDKGSARGGTSWSQGRYRSIVDAVSHTCRVLVPIDDPGNDSYGEADEGTSFAAPTVSAMAIDFIDYYKQERNNDIDDPGYLYVNLLLFGDRAGPSSKLDDGYDNLWGAGRLKARMYNTEGMDSTWKFRDSHFCLDDSETRTVGVSSSFPSNADMIKAVAWWYDPEHESGGIRQIVDLDLLIDGQLREADHDSYDNKRRIYRDMTGDSGTDVDLRFSGIVVGTNDSFSCDTDSVRVYYAYYYEETDRDDSDGPGDEIEADI